MKRKLMGAFGLATVAVGAVAPVALADHNASPYHWNRNYANPLYINAYDNNNNAVGWGSFDNRVYGNWNDVSPYVKILNKGVASSRPADAHIYVQEGDFYATCNGLAPDTWVGCSEIVADGNMHIIANTLKLDRTFAYMTARRKQSAKCHELGHNLGIWGHTGGHGFGQSCMYPSVSDAYKPNNADYEALSSIYGYHGASREQAAGKPVGWARASFPLTTSGIRRAFCAGKVSVHVRAITLTGETAQRKLTRLSRPAAIPASLRCG